MSYLHGLSNEKKQDIRQHLFDHSTEEVFYYETPDDERMENSCRTVFGIVKHDRKYILLSCNDEDYQHLDEVETFDTMTEARNHARKLADDIRFQMDLLLDELKDQEWEKGADNIVDLEGPFMFRDTDSFRNGYPMNTKEDVFMFFRQNSWLFEDNPGNLYSSWMTDANGTPCWVTRSHRGEMRMEGREVE